MDIGSLRRGPVNSGMNKVEGECSGPHEFLSTLTTSLLGYPYIHQLKKEQVLFPTSNFTSNMVCIMLYVCLYVLCYDTGCTLILTVLVATIDAQWEGMGK